MRPPEPEQGTSVAGDVYPVAFAVDYPDRDLNRLSTFFRIFAAIPIVIVLSAVSGGYAFESASDETSTVVATGGGLLVLPVLLMISSVRSTRAGGLTGTAS